MPGSSGRVVLEINPEIKRRLYSKLAQEGMTLKQWFLDRADSYLTGDGSVQLDLRLVDEREGEPDDKKSK